MLDAKRLRTDFEQVKKILQRRGGAYPELEQFGEWDIKRRDLIHESETLKARRNEVSQEVAQRKRNKEEADHLILEMREVGDQIKQIDDQLREVEEQLDHLLQSLPNLPHSSVPDGSDESENVTIRSWGEPAEFSSPRAHWELAEEFDLLDFEAAAKVTGSRFVFYKGVGARLERALLSFMIDLHVDRHGYTEMMPPFMVNQSSMFGTGNFPKFKEDVFAVSGTDYYLIPTAEVPLTNYFRDSIMTAEQIPTKFCGWSTNFRSEAGSAGRDTRGLIRQHQFNKVELVQFVDPLLSYEHLEQLTADAEQVLQRLKLPYRVVALCGGDLSFSSAKTYDLEVWLPQAGTYREISSCSNFEDFQARRANIRFKRDIHSKPELVHTLNGSGLAIGRTVAAILENGQGEDGTIHIPEALQPYMGGMDTIK